MNSFGYTENSEFVLHSAYQASLESEARAHPEEPMDWEAHYYTALEHCPHKRGLPRPMMYKRREPCWTGDLKPEGSKSLEDGYMWVCTMSGKHVIVHQSDLSHPSDKQYEKHFKKPVSEYRYFLSSSKKCGISVRRVSKREVVS